MIRQVVEDCFDLITVPMQQKHLESIIEIDPELDKVEFYSDFSRLKQVIVNLVSNSLKFTYRGFIKIKAVAGSINGKEDSQHPASSIEKKELLASSHSNKKHSYSGIKALANLRKYSNVSCHGFEKNNNIEKSEAMIK